MRELRQNPKNWRQHPQEQRDALRSVLEDVGIAGALIARETPHGLELVDGHLRSDMDADASWPVLVLDVNEQEANTLLATLDPIANLAVTNEEALSELLKTLEPKAAELQALLDSLLTDEPEFNEPEPPEPAPAPEPDAYPARISVRCRESDLADIRQMIVSLLESTGFKDVTAVR